MKVEQRDGKGSLQFTNSRKNQHVSSCYQEQTLTHWPDKHQLDVQEMVFVIEI